MKKFYLLTKTLLVMALLCVGSMSVWASGSTAGVEGNTTGWATDFTDTYTLAGNGTYSFTFYTTNATDATYRGWTMFVSNSSSDVWNGWMYCRAGAIVDHTWGTPQGTETPTVSTTYSGSSIMDAMNGATVNMVVTRNATAITAVATVTPTNGEDPFTETFTYTYGNTDDATADLYITFTVDLGYVNISDATYTPAPITGLPTTYTTAYTATSPSPFNAGTIKDNTASGGNGYVLQVAAAKNSTATAVAYFDSDTSSDGNQAYTLDEDEQITISFTAFNGYYGNEPTNKFAVKNSAGTELVSYTYNSNSCKITDVSLGGSTVDGFEAFSGISYNTSKKHNVNGFSDGKYPYSTASGDNPTVTITISQNGAVRINFNQTSKSINNTYSKTLDGVTMDLAQIAITNTMPNIDASSNTYRASGYGNITISSATIPKATVTYKYEDTNGTDLSLLVADKEVSEAVGATISGLITSDYTTSFYSADESIRYDYSTYTCSDETVQAGGSTITLKFTPNAKFTYNVYAVDGDETQLGTIATVSAYASDETSVAWSKYVNIDDQWYMTSETTFTQTGITEAGSKNVTYATTSVDYAFEFENLSKSGSFAATSSGSERSAGSSARFGKNSRAWTTAISSGTYTLDIYCYGENAKTPTLPLYICDTDGSNAFYIGEAPAATASAWASKQLTGIVIPEGKALCFYNTDASNNSNYLVDYFTLTRTGDATVSKTIDATLGWGTYCSPYALDFSGSIANLTKAYLVTGGEDGQLELSDITGTIPANTGILLEGSGAVSIPVVASSLTDVSSNKLIGVTANTPGVAAGIYVLLNGADDVSGPVGFYKTANAFTIGANTAYLPSGFDAVSVGARSAYFFGGITGISEAEATAEVAQKEGKFIENGKLVIVKNGKKFNANGTEIK